MKRLLFSFFNAWERCETRVKRLSSRIKSGLNRNRVSFNHEKDSLKGIGKEVENYRKLYNKECEFYKKISVAERVESNIQTGIDIIIFLLVILFTLYFLRNQLYDQKVIQDVIFFLHTPSIVLGCFVVILKSLQIRKYYYEFKLGYGERVLQNYLKKYWDNT